MRVDRLVLAMIAICWAQPSLAAIRAVFVGIDEYAYSEPNVDGAGFKDLKGAVNDTHNIKKALRAAYNLDLDLDADSAKPCKTANAVSITLINKCATRDAIFKAWQKQIDASAKGDTLILYFAGHGSQLTDNDNRQASGFNSTIMPHDARDPKATEETEILDIDVKQYIDRATARGVNVVSIFDSCNSATATREGPADGDVRSAPPRKANGPLKRVAPYRPPGFGEGYRVHLAAAADGEQARENGKVGIRSGVFTTALVKTLPALSKATFADIATAVRLEVPALGPKAQQPHAEGALTATMGGDIRYVPLLDAENDAGTVWLAGGELTGVTVGSTYDLFETTTNALDNKSQVASATVKSVETARAVLSIDKDPNTLPKPPKRLVARETAHAFGAEALLVRNGGAPQDSARIAQLLRDIDFVRVGEPARLAVTLGPDGYNLTGTDGAAISTLGPLLAPEFAQRLRNDLQKIARVQLLLSLLTDPTLADAAFCISNDLNTNAYGCEPTTQSDGPVIAVGKQVKLIARNLATEPRYIYVLAIDETFGVTLALPEGGGIDSAVAKGRPITASGTAGTPGRLTFLTLSTDQPIKASVLEQSGAGARDPAACDSLLARALCAAQKGARDPSIPRVGNWTATVTSVIAKQEGP